MKAGVDLDAALDRIGATCVESSTGQELFERLSDDLHHLIPHDGAAWFGVDPVTLLASSPVRIEGLHQSSCDTFWFHEFHVADAALFVDLARSPEPATTLNFSLDGDLIRSARYREVLRPHGYGDELRAALRSGDNTWGTVGLMRDHGREPFASRDVALMNKASGIIAAALRGHVRTHSPWLDAHCAPGLIVFDHQSRVLSANDHALYWLRQLIGTDGVEPCPCDGAVGDEVQQLLTARHLEREVSPVWALLARARAVADGVDSRAARLRLRDQRGRWLVLHATTLTSLQEVGGDTIAVVIEPAKSSEIAPIVIDAYSLTRREQDVVAALASGDTTSEVATRLFLSQHTVRDHIKTVFDKVGVSSRAELVAKLFAEHYREPAHADMVHV